jgi:Bacteriophage protein gp37
MADKTHIEWADATWNPILGCTRASEACRNCYAEIMASRFSGPGQWGEGLARIVDTPTGKDHRWTGEVRFREDMLDTSLRWRKPRRIFVCSTSDLFQERVPDEWIDRVFAVMALAPQHTFQVLTKRPERMRDYLRTRAGDWMVVWPDANPPGRLRISRHEQRLAMRGAGWPDAILRPSFPLANVWLGVSVEDQATANERVPLLLETPATVRWASYEPALGPVDWDDIVIPRSVGEDHFSALFCEDPGEDAEFKGATLDWIVMGGESGPGARPMHPDWARQTRDQCAAAGVPFLFKQWGEWEVSLDRNRDDPDWRADYRRDYGDEGKSRWLNLAGGRGFHGERFHVMRRVGKKHSGRLLDGVLHDAYPEAR